MTSETLWQMELDGLERNGQMLLSPEDHQAQEVRSTTTTAREAKQSLRYLLSTALEYGKMGSYVDLLDRVAAFPRYSPYNALLVMLQLPAAKHVRPAHHWEERFGRRIRPNQQPLVMLQPGGPLMYLFDVSQTEAGPDSKPLPQELTDPFAMNSVADAGHTLHWVNENAKWDGVRVSEARQGHDYAGCIWPAESGITQEAYGAGRRHHRVPVRYETLLNGLHTPTARLATLAHELGHLYCGHVGTHDEDLWADRREMPTELKELEAESVARVVFGRRYPGVDLPDHLRQYFEVEPELTGLDLERVLTAAGRILETADGYRPRRPKIKTKSARTT